jgi:hypothetical protein
VEDEAAEAYIGDQVQDVLGEQEAKVAAQVRTDQSRCSQSRAASLERLGEFAGHEATRLAYRRNEAKRTDLTANAGPAPQSLSILLRLQFGNTVNCEVPPRRRTLGVRRPINRQTLEAASRRTLRHCGYWTEVAVLRASTMLCSP